MPQQKYLKIATFHLMYCGIYEVDSNEKIYKKFALLSWKIVYILIVAWMIIKSFLFLFFQSSDLTEGSNVLRDTVGHIFAFIYLSYSNINRRRLYNYIGKIQRFHDKSDNPIEVLTMEKDRKNSDLIVVFSVGTLCASIFVYTALLLSGDRSTDSSGWFPYHVPYALTCICQMLFALNVCPSVLIGDTLLLASIFLIKQQFKMLKSNLKFAYYQALKITGTPQRDIDKIYTNLSKIDINSNLLKVYDANVQATLYRNLCASVEHHQFLLDTSNDLVDILSPLIAIKVGSSIVYLLLISLSILTQTEISEISKLSGFIILNLIILFYFCLSGEILLENSDLYDAIKDTPWYLYDSKSQKLLINVLLRTNHLIYLRAGPFLNMNLVTYISILRSLYSYVTVVYQMIGDN